VLWAVLLKPTVKSTAKEAANDALVEPLKQASAQIAALAAKVSAPPPAPLVPGPPTPASAAAAAALNTPAPGAPVALAADNAAGGLGTPTDGRLELGPGKQTNQYPVPAGKTLSLTDIFFENPQGDSGLLRIRRGDTTLLALRLDNFRDLDYHFVSPWVFNSAQPLILAVECQKPTPDSCTPAASFSGVLRPA
jgi:hypothetical protein